MIRVVHINGPLWGIESSSCSKVLNEEAKRTPGMRFIPETRIWQGYADAVHVTAKRAHQKGLLIHGQIERPEASGLLVARKGLRDYQNVGVDFLIAKSSEGCLLADELGLGKTCQAIIAARALRQKAVIVCPNFGRGVWLDEELPRWWPAAKVVGLSGIKPETFLKTRWRGLPLDVVWLAADVAVIHPEILYAWVNTLIAWGARTLIIDEGQIFTGHDARRTLAVKKLAATCSHRMMLTGTPVKNRVKDLYSPMDIISPGRFGEKFFGFGHRYCAGHEEQIEVRVEGVKTQRRIWKFDGESNIEELHERLTYSKDAPWGSILRRQKSDVALELPTRQRQIITVEVAKSHMAPIRDIRSDGVLRQALNMAADGKFPQVIDLAVGHLEAGHKVVVGAYRRAIAEMIADGIALRCPSKGITFFHGETPLAKRQALIKSKPDCLCVTIDSTAGAINLSHAGVGIIAELVWDPTKLLQWEGRFGRFQGQNVLIQYVCARGTADDLVKRLVIARLGMSQRAIGKTDDKLDEDLRGLAKEGAADRMRKLYERMMADDAA